MKIWNKNIEYVDGWEIKRYNCCGLQILKKSKKNNQKILKFFGGLKFSFKNACATDNYCAKFKKYIKNKNIVLWIDHALGGGTETYSKQQFFMLRKKYMVVRMQYFHWIKSFVLSAPNCPWIKKCYVAGLDELKTMMEHTNVQKIVVNNLVGYQGSLDILDFVTKLKESHHCHVSYRGHDFQAICPSFNLLDCDGKFCHFKYRDGCEKCWGRKRLSDIDLDNTILRSGANKISDWRAQWGNFFANTCDEVIVFSNRIRDMFTQIYPQVGKKIVVKPHTVPILRHVDIPAHDGINIAFLGGMQKNKGSDIMYDMCRLSRNDAQIKFFLVGNMLDHQSTPDNLCVTGKYLVRKLPSIIETNKIDAIFISSICPETFSYTTSEAISMGIPVICYNIGAQAERVEKYEHGLVLDEISPEKNLNEIIRFLKDKKRK